MSGLVVSSSTASYRPSSFSGSVDGCKTLLLRSLDPIEVNVVLRRPKRQSFDLETCKFWINSRETMVFKSIIIDPSEGSYLIRNECAANFLHSSSSIYFKVCNGCQLVGNVGDEVSPSKSNIYRSQTACSKVIPFQRHFDRLQIILEC